ncbi:MAG: phosphoglycerate kinase [Gammaproteobacteria bacterium]|nr:phosphoglycerate kinase [Gammaproteobacteria bacterium]
MSILSMADLDLTNQRVLIREDLNVPVKDGRVTSAKRIQAALPTIHLAIEKGAKVILLSHRGRPMEGQYNEEQSLLPIANYFGDICDLNVRLEKNWIDGVELDSGEIVLCENVRFQVGEKANDDQLAKKMASLCDIYVMDAFGTAHRAQASTHGVAKYAPIACAGPLLKKELDSLDKALKDPGRPMVAIVGGSKVSTKLTVLETLLDKVDQLIVGGGITNTFLAAMGKPIGKSLYEKDLLSKAKDLLAKARSKNTQIPLPTDVVCATEFSEHATATVKLVDEVSDEDMILDIGPQSAQKLASYMADAGTIVWNGPVGVFEFEAFSHGSETVARAIANSKAFSIAGGGDTLAAVDKFGLEDQISYISTGGGAFLEYLEGRPLPAVEILKERVLA